MEMITAAQAAEKWNTSLRNVQDLCKRGRIEGAQRLGKSWMIPTDAIRPVDGRKREVKENHEEHRPLLRKSPFLDMTNLYTNPGTADQCIEALSYHPEAQALFAAEIAYSRGEIDKVYEQAQYFLRNHTGFYAVISAGMLLALCAMWKGDVAMWYEARQHMFEAPCKDDVDRDIVALALASSDSAIRNTRDYPEWFTYGCFDNLPADSHPAARVYYIKYLLVYSQELALGNIELEGVDGLGLMRTLPYIMEPMISQMVADKIPMAEIYLRLLCAIAYHQSGNDVRGLMHLDKAIKLCMADGFYGPLVEHRRQLGPFLDDRLAIINPDALKKVKELHKQLHIGWTKLHNAVLDKSVQVTLSNRERQVARLAAFGMTDSEIAGRLHLSESSVKAAIKNAKNKVGVNSRLKLGIYV